jgi:integrase
MTREKYLYSKTVKGHDYLYFRLPSGKLVRLPTDQSSPEFRFAYDEALRAVAPAPDARTAKIIPHSATIAAAIDVYLDSLEFRSVKPRTQERYRDACDIMRDQLGSCRLRDLKISNIDVYSEVVTKERGSSIADLHVSLLKMIFEVCRKHAQFNIADLANPCQHAKRRYEVKHAHRAWSDEALEKFAASAPEHMRLALLLLWFSGQRGGDVVKMRWSDFDGAGLSVRPEKTNGEAEAEANYHVCPLPLLQALQMAPRHGEFILTKKDGQPFANSNLLGKAMRRELVKAGLAEIGATTFTMHGLRKRAAKDAAELGGVAGAQSVTGHKSERMAAYYAAGASTRRVNASTAQAWGTEAAKRHSWLPTIVNGGKAA